MKFSQIMAIWGVLISIMVMGFVLLSQPDSWQDESKERANGYRLDNCIKLANEIGLDPNDSERAEVIKNCYNEKE